MKCNYFFKIYRMSIFMQKSRNIYYNQIRSCNPPKLLLNFYCIVSVGERVRSKVLIFSKSIMSCFFYMRIYTFSNLVYHALYSKYRFMFRVNTLDLSNVLHDILGPSYPLQKGRSPPLIFLINSTYFRNPYAAGQNHIFQYTHGNTS